MHHDKMLLDCQHDYVLGNLFMYREGYGFDAMILGLLSEYFLYSILNTKLIILTVFISEYYNPLVDDGRSILMQLRPLITCKIHN